MATAASISGASAIATLAGSFSGWSAGGGAQGSNRACSSDYPNNLRTWATYGPLDLSQATSAHLSFYVSGRAENASSGQCQYDYLFAGSSTDNNSYTGVRLCGDWTAGTAGNGYSRQTVDLSSRLGQAQVWVAFLFKSDDSIVFNGLHIDDVRLDVTTGAEATLTPPPGTPVGTPTVTPTGPTPTRTPSPTPCTLQFKTGVWQGAADFIVSADRTHVENFEFEIGSSGTACGRRVLSAARLPINNCRIEFAYSDSSVSITGQGSFIEPDRMSGSGFMLCSTGGTSSSWFSYWLRDATTTTPTPTVSPDAGATTTATPTATATRSTTTTPTPTAPPGPGATATATPTASATPNFPLYFPWVARVAPGFPAAPVLSVSQPERDRAALSWTSVTRAMVYHLWHSSSSDMAEAEKVYTGTLTTATLTLPLGTHYFRAAASNQWGTSPSNVVTVVVVPPSPTPMPTPTPTIAPIGTPGTEARLYLCGCGTARLSSTPCGIAGVVESCVFQGQWEGGITLTGDIEGDTYSFALCLNSYRSSPTTYTANILLNQGQTISLASATFEVERQQFCSWQRATVRGINPTSDAGDRLSLTLTHNASFGQVYYGLIDSQIRIPPVR